MPSPVLMLALVVNGKTFPHPPVASTTARAVIARIRPVASSTATTPCTRPSSTSRRVTNHSSYRAIRRYFREVWNKRVQHVETGLVGREPGAHPLHAAEGADRHPAVRLPAPRAPPVLELQQLARRLLHERLDGVLVAQPVAPGDRVVGVLVEGVALRDHTRPHRPRPTPCGCAWGRPSRRRPRRVPVRSRRWRWRPGARRRRPRRGARRGRRPPRLHSPRNSSSTSTLPRWSTICRWTLPSWNSSRWLWHPQE